MLSFESRKTTTTRQFFNGFKLSEGYKYLLDNSIGQSVKAGKKQCQYDLNYSEQIFLVFHSKYLLQLVVCSASQI